MRLGLTKLPTNAVAPDITDAVGSPSASGWKLPGSVTDIFTGVAKTYQDYLTTRAQIENARLRAKTDAARLRRQYKQGAYYDDYDGYRAVTPMQPATRKMLMIGAGVIAVIAIGYTVIEKKKGKR